MFAIDKLGFSINLMEPRKETDSLNKIIMVISPQLNGEEFSNNSVSVDLYQLAVMYQRVKLKISPSDILPYVCMCGDNGCIGVFSHIEQKVGLIRVTWDLPQSAIDDNEYEFLPKKSYSFSKKEFLNEIDTLFNKIEVLIKDGEGKTIYDVEAFYKLENALNLWHGEVPGFKSKDEIIKEAVNAGEDVDPNEVLTLDDIIKKTSQLIKDSANKGDTSN